MSVLEILPSCHNALYFIKTKSRDQETANMVAESQSLQVIHEEKRDWACSFFSRFTMMYKKRLQR